MLEQINDSINECGLVSPGTGFVSCAKQQQSEVKKTALRDLQNDNIMVLPQNAANRGLSTDGVKVSGTKRPIPECPMGPPCRQPSSSNGTNGNLVYIRRKSDYEVEKSNTSDNVDNNTGCPQLRQFSHGIQGAARQQVPLYGPKSYSALAPIPGAVTNTYSTGGPSLPPCLGNPVTALPSAERNHPTVTSGTISVNSQNRSDQDFKERFFRLQAFLKSYDNSSHEEYTQMLRALPSVGRSRHAVELEKRAIHLLLEEKKELERMKVLNVLGQSSTTTIASPSTMQPPSGK